MRFWRKVLRNQRIRVALYVLVVAALFLVRGPQWWKDTLRAPEAQTSASARLDLAGAVLAPTLVDALLTSYRRDYPLVTVESRGGGTTHALQALLDADAQVALLCRPPLASEQILFEEADGAPLLVEPVALAGLALLVSADAALDSLDTTSLVAWLAPSNASGDGALGIERLYAEDPNLGWWEALLSDLDLPLDLSTDRERVIFVRDRSEMFEALRRDPRGIGLVSTIFLVHDEAPAGLRALRVRRPDGIATRPTYTDVGHGRYPLLHSLYVACRANARGEPAKFVTFASGARGQRIVERAGFLPARQFMREILLDGKPVGAS